MRHRKSSRRKLRQSENAKRGSRYKAAERNISSVQYKSGIKVVDTLSKKGILQPPTRCDVCKSVDIVFTTYGSWPDTAPKATGKHYAKNALYGCCKCGARVGVHRDMVNPLGYMADEETRWARAKYKTSFIELTKTHFGNNKDLAYYWLATVMELPPSKAHWGMFNPEQCRKAHEHCIAMLFSNNDEAIF